MKINIQNKSEYFCIFCNIKRLIYILMKMFYVIEIYVMVLTSTSITYTDC